MKRSWFYQKRSYLWSDYLHDLGVSADFLEAARRYQLAGVVGIPHHLVIYSDVFDVSLFFQKRKTGPAIIGGVARCQGAAESVPSGAFDRWQLGRVYLLCRQWSDD